MLGLLCANKFGTPPTDIPIYVLLCRIAPRALDPGGNLGASLKHVQDGVADWLGIDDRDPRIIWEYEQRRGAPRYYGVRVAIGVQCKSVAHCGKDPAVDPWRCANCGNTYCQLCDGAWDDWPELCDTCWVSIERTKTSARSMDMST